MGGRTFHQDRLPRAAYVAFEAEVRAFLDARIPGRWRIPVAVGDKPDFGDMDILVASAVLDGGAAVVDEFCAAFGVQARTRANTAHSVLTPTPAGALQVDFFPIPEGELDVCAAFMSYGDLGNMLGRLLRRLSLVWGQDGLSALYRRPEDDHYKRVWRFSTSIDDALTAAGLDPARYHRGFATQREVFEYVVSSPRFTPDAYLAPRGEFARRVKERPGMVAFAAYLRELGFEVPDAPEASPEERALRRAAGQREATALFPQLSDFYAEETRRAEIDATVARRLNLERVRALRPELSEYQLATLWRGVKNRPDFTAWVYGAASAELDAHVLALPAPEDDPVQAAAMARKRDERARKKAAAQQRNGAPA